MNIGLIVQARMSSQRLPNKVLTMVNGQPLLKYLLERLAFCSSIDKVIVATSEDKSDDPIELFCKEHGVLFFRGPLQNVAKRFYLTIQKYNLDVFVRVCCDSPMLDQSLIDHGVQLFNGEYDLVTNIMPRSYPVGQSIEVIRSSTYKTVFEKMSKPGHLEHVTKYYYENPIDFKIKSFTNEIDLSKYRLAVDTPEDLKQFKKLTQSMTKSHTEYNFNDLIRLYQSNKGAL